METEQRRAIAKESEDDVREAGVSVVKQSIRQGTEGSGSAKYLPGWDWPSLGTDYRVWLTPNLIHFDSSNLPSAVICIHLPDLVHEPATILRKGGSEHGW